jgi:tetratricopeptide (TPR) repeat protein
MYDKLMLVKPVISNAQKVPKIIKQYNQMMGQFHYLCGIEAKKSGDTEIAMKNFNEALHYNADVYLVNYQIGMMHFKNNEFEKALEFATKEKANNPAHTPNLCLIGSIHSEWENWEDAIKAYDEALLYDPLNYFATQNAAEIYRIMGLPNQAKELLDTYLTKQPDSLFEFKRQMALISLGRSREVESFLSNKTGEATIEKDILQCAVQYKNGDIERAQDSCKKALKKDEGITKQYMQDPLFKGFGL